MTSGELTKKMKASCLAATSMNNLMPAPNLDERPSLYADRVGEWYVAQKSPNHRKTHGLYLTPVPVADFMSKQIQATGKALRILDPAAGAGVLCCAVGEALASRPIAPETIEIVAYEMDPGLSAPLRGVLKYLVDWCHARYGIEVTTRIEVEDFVLACAEALRRLGALFPYDSSDQDFDVVISNPPYFKINKADPRAIAASAVVHGQPNIYGIFMAVGATLLRQGGDFIFITPRSFASGSYFRQFREKFFTIIRPTRVHVFGSRRDAFSRDEVLQENIILSGVRQDHWDPDNPKSVLVISSSWGVSDIGDPDSRTVPMRDALNLQSGDKVLRLPLSDADDEILSLVDSWPTNLKKLGLNISTGPVVPFRFSSLIDKQGDISKTHVPLLWMSHVRAMQVTWPIDRHKPEYIKRSGAEKLLVANNNYVLMRRFSAKEEARRLTAAPYLANNFAVSTVGLENHLNYVHRPGSTLTEDETWGLAALYNSRLLNRYFRCVNGNTQVSATELRAMPLPAQEIIVALGRQVKLIADPMDGLDELVMGLIVNRPEKETAIG